MNKQFFNIDNNKKSNRQNNTLRNSTKSPALSDGDFSRRPPHTPPKGSNTSTKGKKNK